MQGAWAVAVSLSMNAGADKTLVISKEKQLGVALFHLKCCVTL
jgi:hypothetical protein